MSSEGHNCWEDCDEGPHGCVCGNDCLPPLRDQLQPIFWDVFDPDASTQGNVQAALDAAMPIIEARIAKERVEERVQVLQDAVDEASTPQDTEWEYVCNNGEYRRFTDSLESARRWEDRGYTIRRRRAPSPAGPWEPVPTEGVSE